MFQILKFLAIDYQLFVHGHYNELYQYVVLM